MHQGETASFPASGVTLVFFMLLLDALHDFNGWRALKVKGNTVQSYLMILRHFCIYMRNSHIEEVKLEDVSRYFTLMREFGYQVNTFIPIGIAFRKFFEYHHRKGLTVIDPWLIPIPQREFNMPRVVDEATYKKILDIIPTSNKDPRHVRNRALITLLWDTGARNGELLSLKVDDLNLPGQRAFIKTEKSQGARPFREIFWTASTHAHLLYWLERRERLLTRWNKPDQKALFLCVSTHLSGQPLSTKGVGEFLRRYANQAHIPYMNAHAFRHSKARRILLSNGSGPDVMNVLGHATLASSTPYTKMWGKDLEETARKFL